MAFVFPIFLTVIALIAILIAYGGIRQGAARVYSLEREAILRRATAAMFIGAGLFIVTIALVLYQFQQIQAAEEEVPVVEDAAIQSGETPDPQAPLSTPPPQSTNQLPGISTVTFTPTIDPNLPTATSTPIIVRAFVTGTGGNGLTLRSQPGGDQIAILGEDEFVTVQYEEGTLEQGGFTWVKVRTFLGDEGWVADQFLEIEGDN